MAIVVNGKVLKSEEIGKSDPAKVLRDGRGSFDDYSQIALEQTLKTLNR